MKCRLSPCTKLFIGLLIVLMLATFGWGYCLILKVGSVPPPYPQSDSTVFTVNIAGDISKSTGLDKLDSIYQTIKSNQEWIIRRQETLVNDLRQETNNNIDKLSIWTGVMLGFVALFGCLVPMMQSKDYRDELEKEIKRELKETRRELNSELNDDIKKWNSKIDKQLKEGTDLLSKLKRQLALSELQSAAECLSIGLDSHQMDNNASLRAFTGNLWNKVCGSFETLVKLVKSDFEGRNDGYRDLENDRILLVQALEVIDEIMRRVAARTDDIRSRSEAELGQSNLRLLLGKVCNSTFVPDEVFITELDQLANQLALLHLRL